MILALILAAQSGYCLACPGDGWSSQCRPPEARCPVETTPHAISDVLVIDGHMFKIEMTAEATDPHFQRSAKGWLPTCPAGMDLVRHNPKPDCLWGPAPMNSKPTQGEFECVPVAQVPKVKCPVE